MGYAGTDARIAPIKANYYREWLRESARQGIPFVHTHMEGDGAVSRYLDMVEEIQKEMGPAATKGWGIDHCTVVNPADFPRAAKLGIMFSCAPKYVSATQGALHIYGEGVADSFIYPVNGMLKAGAKVAYEIDGDRYVWDDVELMLTRRLDNNVWGPNERIDRVAALKMITISGAEYLQKADKMGSIQAGKLADLVVLDRDYMSIPEDELSEIQVQLTLIDGKIRFVQSEFAQEYRISADGAIVSSYDELVKRRGPNGQPDPWAGVKWRW
jgi:predicted amidohydrolase YtcJ